MIRIASEGDCLNVAPDDNELRPRDASQLGFWGFAIDPESGRFQRFGGDRAALLLKVTRYFQQAGAVCLLNQEAEGILQAFDHERENLRIALERGKHVKDGDLRNSDAFGFLGYLTHVLARPLKEHQRKAAVHLLVTGNAANFSVPGSGKTAVVLSVFGWLRSQHVVDSLFVIGPVACFGPWREEYKSVFGTEPNSRILAGGDLELRRSHYAVNAATVSDVYLTTFQTLLRDSSYVRVLFQRQKLRFFLVIDEAHYIKQLDGAWATAVLGVARYAARRCVLTGTPFPQSFEDGFNLMDVLWPSVSPLTQETRARISMWTQKDDCESAGEAMSAAIGPLFYRVRKIDLGLAPQVFHEPVVVDMAPRERTVYDTVLDRIDRLSRADYFRDMDLVLRLRRGRMMRLRQCVSWVHLLRSALDDYAEDLVSSTGSLAHIVSHYSDIETPGKVTALRSLLMDVMKDNQKIIVWSTFVETLQYLMSVVETAGFEARLIYGGTPVQSEDVQAAATREGIIRDFNDPRSPVRVLVANPAACAESVSLHACCAQAIYYDLSYNCAQYIQSLDRIHRVGGSENRPSHYYFLQYRHTIDADILANVQKKAQRMSAAIDRDCAVYSLDMFDDMDELQAYERLFIRK